MKSEADGQWARALSLSRELSDLLDKMDRLHRPIDVDELANCHAAVRTMMGSSPKFVEDENDIWPMTKGHEFWVGPLRINGSHVEQLRFYPDYEEHENLVWCRIATMDGDLP